MSLRRLMSLKRLTSPKLRTLQEMNCKCLSFIKFCFCFLGFLAKLKLPTLLLMCPACTALLVDIRTLTYLCIGLLALLFHCFYLAEQLLFPVTLPFVIRAAVCIIEKTSKYVESACVDWLEMTYRISPYVGMYELTGLAASPVLAIGGRTTFWHWGTCQQG